MHFQSKLHNNSILTGSVDSYCLVCDNYLRSEDEAFAHTEKPIHKKNMLAAVRVEKFLDDWIIKVKKGYYCPFCNILLTTTTKVTIHIGDNNHQENKGAQMLTHAGDIVVAFDEVAIIMASWHGLIDNTCVICNTEFDDGMHKSDQNHMLKLVQSKCEFGDKFIYRKVDVDSFFCLICASVFFINEKLNHHENASHRNLYKSGKELKNKISLKVQETKLKPKPAEIFNTNVKKPLDNNADMKKAEKIDKVDTTKPEVKYTQNPASVFKPSDGKIKIEISNDKETITLLKNSAIACGNSRKPGIVKDEAYKKPTNVTDKANQSDVLDRVDEFQKKGINIDFTSEKARCKQCGENIPFDTIAIERHINAHKTEKKTIIEAKDDSQKQKKLYNSNNVNTDTKKIEPKTEKKNDDIVEPKNKDTEPKSDTKKIDIVEHKQDPKKQQTKSESSNDGKTDAKKFENVQPTQDIKKSINNIEMKTDTKKTNNKTEPNINLKKQKKSRPNIRKEVGKIETKITNNATEPKTDKKELEILAKHNKMVIMPNEVYCPQCKVGTDLNTIAVNAHANSNGHKEKTSQKQVLGKRPTESMDTFIHVESNLGSDIILNNKYVLRHHSFHCIIMDDDSYKCMLCDIMYLKTGEINLHMNGPDHKNKPGLFKVVSSMPKEFIREITSDVYHCGYCNVVFESWTEMQDHLSHSLHVYARRHAQWKLERFHTVIRNTKLMQISDMKAINFA